MKGKIHYLERALATLAVRLDVCDVDLTHHPALVDLRRAQIATHA